jgi:hypothetical protein
VATNTKRKIVLSVCLIAIILVSAFSVASLLNKASDADYTSQAQKVFQDAVIQVEKIRNITLPHVDLEVVTKQWAIDTWGKGYADPDLTNILREEKVYKGLFMMPENASLYQANVDWAGNFGAATWNDKIYIVKENFNPWNLPNAEATFVHELTHIWQPQLSSPTTFDANKAHTALVEGDASYMGDYFINQTKATPAPLVVDQVPLFLLGNSLLSEVHPDLPRTISYLNWFPYDYGKLYISALYQNDGWATVNQVYKNPPDTTQQILYPDKYFSNITAQQVAAPTLAENNWTQTRNDRYGEYFVQVMLGNWLSKNESVQASAGWGGDNFTYYERGNDFLFTWNIKWESSYAASEFYVAFHNMASAAGATGDDSYHWVANGRYVTIVWNQDSNTTLIACSNNQAATVESYFS